MDTGVNYNGLQKAMGKGMQQREPECLQRGLPAEEHSLSPRARPARAADCQPVFLPAATQVPSCALLVMIDAQLRPHGGPLPAKHKPAYRC